MSLGGGVQGLIMLPIKMKKGTHPLPKMVFLGLKLTFIDKNGTKKKFSYSLGFY